MYLLKRKKIYHLFYKDEAGKLHSASTRCQRKSDANKFAVLYLQQLKENSKKKTILTYREFQDFYKTYASSRFTKSYQEFIGYAFQQFERVVGKEILLKSITELHIEEFIKLKLSEAGQRIVNGYLRTLQGAFQRAIELGFLYNNIFKNVKKLRPEQNPPLFLSKEDFEKIIDAEENPKLKFLYKFAVLTGMRMGEIRFLRWDAIDFQKGIIQIRNHNEFTTKSKKARIIPIHPLLIKQLERMKNENSEEYVCPISSAVISDISISPDGNIFASSINEGILRSTDRGETWEVKHNGIPTTKIRPVAVNSRGEVFTAAYDEGIYMSDDDGENWTEITDNMNLVQVRSIFIDDNDNLYLATDESVWRSNPDSLTSITEDENLTPGEYSLSQNYPNPFNPATVIKYQIPESGYVTLKIYDILGKEITTLVNEEKSAGRYELNFNASGLSSGVYIYQVKVNGFISSRKMVMMK